MASKDKRICYTCGKEYRYCGHCAQYKNLPTWMNIVCSEECKDIYQICGKYNVGKYTKAEAAELLDQYSVATKSFYNETINQTVAEIYGLNSPSEVVNEVVEDAVEEVIEDTVADEMTEDMTEVVTEDVTEVDATVAVATVEVESTTEATTKTATATKKKTSTTKKKTATLDE